MFTTLVFKYEGRGNLDRLLQRFSYETRLTTKDFLDHLFKSTFTLDDFSKEPLSDVIRNEKWFRHQWKFDPNIKGCLKCLMQFILNCSHLLKNFTLAYKRRLPNYILIYGSRSVRIR